MNDNSDAQGNGNCNCDKHQMDTPLGTPEWLKDGQGCIQTTRGVRKSTKCSKRFGSLPGWWDEDATSSPKCKALYLSLASSLLYSECLNRYYFTIASAYKKYPELWSPESGGVCLFLNRFAGVGYYNIECLLCQVGIWEKDWLVYAANLLILNALSCLLNKTNHVTNSDIDH